LLGHFSALLDCARTSQDAANFKHRLHTPGFVNAKVVRYLGEIQQILNEHEQREVPIAELWPFLKLLNVLSLDLNTATRQTEAQYKNLLAFTSIGSDAVGAAEATWDELVREAGEGMSHGKSYRREDLPQHLRDRHSPVGDSGEAALRALKDHSAVILCGIRTTIGPDVHLCRDQLVQALREKLEENQVVIVTGAAGSGKSGIAKGGLEELVGDFTFAFRAEEFAAAHLDETLQKNQIPANSMSLQALMAGQGRKLLLIESVERLLEASTRDAFTDLLRLAKSDKGWRFVLTCRDYSAELVRSSLLQFAGVEHSVLHVPLLDDEELNSVQASIPDLLRPFSDPRLKNLLRNPYILDKASQMKWSIDRPLPEDEMAFRAKFWAEIIRADDRPADDKPRRRQNTFVEIALRRARALSQYVLRTDLDANAIQALRSDSLLMFSKISDNLVAPAHDVLEDWAILSWIEEQYAICEHSLPKLAAVIGTYPAIRRTYRKWITELVERDTKAADDLFGAVTADSSLLSQFRDDTLVSLLQSSVSGQLLERHSNHLFANKRQLLHRIIHLIRVACVTTPEWFGGGGALASIMHIPEGAVWQSVLKLAAAKLKEFQATDLLLLLGLAEDAARGVTWQTPYPQGAEYITAIAFWLLPQFDDYRSEGQQKRVLQIIAKLPKCNPREFTKLLQGDEGSDGRDRPSEEFRKLVLWNMEGMQACRDVPDAIINAVRAELILTQEMLRDEYSYWGATYTEPTFGIQEHSHFDNFPASAFRGPFLHLLRFHSKKALDFLIDLFNHSANWYAAGRVPMQFVEKPVQISLTCTDGTKKNQWCNSRLWNLYRGTSVGPYVLQSALMALEEWLLAIAESQPETLDKLLCNILVRSDNAAVAAVVASVATAFPRLTTEALFALLSSPACVLLDRARMASESQAVGMTGMPLRDAIERGHVDERKKANARPHRRHDIEAAISNVQLGERAKQVHDVIDEYRKKMPPIDQQTEDDRIWRLALHRMDLRQYTVSSPTEEQDNSPPQADGSDEPQRKIIRLDLKEAEPDVQRMVDATTRDFAAMNNRLALLMWGISVFERKIDNIHDPAQWKPRLQEAMGQQESIDSEDEYGPGRGGPEYTAAVCIRDHFPELTTNELAWCIETVCNSVESEADNWNETARMQLYSMSGDRPSASVLSCIIGKALPRELKKRLRSAFACAVLHPVDEVRRYAAYGVGENLWSIDPELAIRCVNVLAAEAKAVQKRLEEDRSKPFDKRMGRGRIEFEVGKSMRKRFYGAVAGRAYEQLDVTDWTGSEANCLILSILSRTPECDIAIDAFRRLAVTLVAWWDSDDEGDERRNRDRSIDIEVALTSQFEEFVAKAHVDKSKLIISPILDAIERHPRNTGQILQGIIGFEDRSPHTEQFWHLWELFANRMQAASWLADIADEHPKGGPVLSAVFLAQYWKDGVRHWRSLEGYAICIDRLFETLQPSARILDAYVRFLYYIGEQSLPAAFQLIAKRLQAGNPQGMLCEGNTVFMLETLLRRYVYGRPTELKSNSTLRESVLYLLDTLVENGSSSAYRMRDDFVTPIH